MMRWFLAVSLMTVTVTSSALAQVQPQDLYLQIYMLIKEADKMEASGQKVWAAKRYQKSAEWLQRLKRDFPDWEPTIVQYRISYAQDKVVKLQGSANADPDTKEPAMPVLQFGPTGAPTPAVAPATPSTTANPGGTLSTPAMASSPAVGEGGGGSSDVGSLKTRIRQLENELASTKEQLTKAQTEAAQLRTELDEVKKALTMARSEDADTRVKGLLDENNRLRQRLQQAEQVVELYQNNDGGPSVATLQTQLKKVQEALNLAQSKNGALADVNEEFKQQLENAQSSIKDLSSRLSGGADDPMVRENAMLRDLIRRQLQEQARRESARRLAKEEMDKLKIDSEVLKTQMDILSSPLVSLTDEEKSLLRSPGATLVDESGAVISAPLENGDVSSAARVPTGMEDVAEEAKRLFESRDFENASIRYQTILNEYPNSLYALSNLAVVRFQQGNYSEAEKVLRRTVELSPRDAFSHSVLGIVLYQQGKYEDAVQVLTRAAALDPNDPKTRNYLGIAASQKGWQEAAEQECRRAIELDDTYGDAHFNLAVIYATQDPPSIEMARRHYNRALELGVPRDQELETLIR